MKNRNNILRIEIKHEKNVSICGDGCCYDDGFVIYFYDGSGCDDYFHPSESIEEINNVVNLLKHLYPEIDITLKPKEI